MKQRLFPYLLLLIVLSPALGCRDTSPQQQNLYQEVEGEVRYAGEKPNAVVVHLLEDPANLHPTNGRSTYRSQIMSYCYQYLLTQDLADGSLVPELAAALPEASADGNRYTFTLHPQAAWPDGRPILAEDVIFTAKAMVCPLTDNADMRGYLEYLSGIDPDPADPRRFTVRMSQFYQGNALFGMIFPILDAQAYDPDGLLKGFSLPELIALTPETATDPRLQSWADFFNDDSLATSVEALQNGSGPYRPVSWEPDVRVILERNPAYWGKGLPGPMHAQGPDRIIYQVLSEMAALELQLKQQEIDVSNLLTSELYQRLQANEAFLEHYHLTKRARDSYACLALNNQPVSPGAPAIFGEAAVRRALAYAIPLDQIIEAYFEGMVERVSSPVSPHIADYNDTLPQVPYDPEQAKRLLSEAGWEDLDGDQVREKMVDGQEIELRFPLLYPGSSQSTQDMVTRMRLAWQAVGIACEPKNVDMQQLRTELGNHTYQACLLSLTAPALPYDFKQLFHGDGWPEGSNFFGYLNEKADRYIDSARTEPDSLRRKYYVDRVQEILFVDQPCLFLFAPTKKIAVHRRFNNHQTYPIRDYLYLNRLEVVPVE
jgi:peptide/nickel transport system substrate-binding protein